MKTDLKNLYTVLTLLLWVKVLFLWKNADFLQKNADISKIKTALVLKGIFSKIKYVCLLTYQFQVSSIILTSFRQCGGEGGGGGNFTPLPHLQKDP